MNLPLQPRRTFAALAASAALLGLAACGSNADDQPMDDSTGSPMSDHSSDMSSHDSDTGGMKHGHKAMKDAMKHGQMHMKDHMKGHMGMKH